jgi:hypothetical protein
VNITVVGSSITSSALFNWLRGKSIEIIIGENMRLVIDSHEHALNT